MFTNIAKKLVNYDSNNSFAFKLRVKRAERIKTLITECYNEYKQVTIIDVGGTKTYWNILSKEFLAEKNVHITIVNLPSKDTLPENDGIFTFCVGNGCNLFEFEDNSFHIAHSNSVIEHVGSWENVISFSKELQRIAEKYYLQTPNYWFPIEPHFMCPFLHWLPKSLRVKMISHFDLGTHKKVVNYNEARVEIESYNLLSKREITYLFPDGFLFKERFLFFIKSLIITNSI
jgi:hypothetical protein